MVESGATHAPHSAACYNCKRRFEIAETGVDNGGVHAPEDENGPGQFHCDGEPHDSAPQTTQQWLGATRK